MVKVEIVSCSSENPNHPASNILCGTGFWVCKDEAVGEALQISLKLKLTPPSSIQQVTIQNYNSAYVEIVAGNDEDDLDSFEVINHRIIYPISSYSNIRFSFLFLNV